MTFIPGLELAERFWSEVVRPIVFAQVAPGQVAAGLLGAGSEVLGFDTEQSTDHGWGPRVVVFVPNTLDPGGLDGELERVLPVEFAGYSVRFARRDGEAVRHQVDVVQTGEWFTATVGFDPLEPPGPEEWLGTPTQLLRSVVSSMVFHDGPGAVTAGREALRWYPDEIWRYVLACQWHRLAQHEHLLGRAGQVGDDLGSRLIAARLGRDIIRLCFLIEQVWAPYDKWLGTAFNRLAVAPEIEPLLRSALTRRSQVLRGSDVVAALWTIAERFNELALVPPLDPYPRPFFGRPFLVLDCDRFANALMATTSLAARGWAGAIDQWVDSVDLLSGPALERPALGGPVESAKYHWLQPRES